MAARSKARKRALDILFASELRSEDPVEALLQGAVEGEAAHLALVEHGEGAGAGLAAGGAVGAGLVHRRAIS